MTDVNAVLRAQAGAIHRRQVVALGISRRRLAALLRARAWARVLDQVYVVGGAPVTFRQRCWIAVLAVRYAPTDGTERRVAVAGRSAAYLHGLDVAEPSRVELVVPISDSAPSMSDVRIVRASTWPRRLFTADDGLVLTGLADTIVDVAFYVPRDHLHAIVQETVFHRPRLPDAILGACRRGRRGSAAARRATALVRAGVDSSLHERGRGLVAAAGLPEPECGVVVARGAGPSDCVVRAAGASCPPYGLVVEWDGDAHRVDRATFLHDREKDRLVRRAGYVTVRYTADQVGRRDPVIADLRAEWATLNRTLQPAAPFSA